MSEPIRVLLVDDEESFRKPMMERLTKRNFQVEEAASGPEALAKAQGCGGNYHVAIIDQIMGPPNGIETMRQLHQLYPAIEVIILTGWGDMEPGEKAMEMGAYRYMSKPISNVEELVLNIRTASRLGRERQRGRALQALVRAGQRIGGTQSEEELYQKLYEETRELLPELGGFLVSYYDEQNQVVFFPFCYVRGEGLTLPPRKNGNGITEFVLRRKEPMLLPYGDEAFRQEHCLQPPDPNLGYCISEISVPMFLEGRSLGTINAMAYQTDVRYTQQHLEVLQAFANQAAVAIQNVQQLEEARQLRDAITALAGQRGKEAVLRAIVTEAHRLIGYDYTSLILHDEDGTLRKVRPVMPEYYLDRFEEPRQQGGITRLVVKKRELVIIPDAGQDPRVKESMRKAGIRSILAMPLIYGDRVLSVLYGHTSELRYFSSHEVNLWSAFAAQAAAALHSALEEEREVEDAKRLADELGTLVGKLNLEETMTRVASAAKSVFQADTCRLAYVDPPTGRIVAWAWAEGDPEVYRYEGEPRPDGITYHVLRTKKPVFRSDTNMQEKPFPHPELLARGLRSVAALPLLHGGRVMGVLYCNYLKRRQPFSEHLKMLFEAFSARAAVALDRACGDQMNGIWRELDRQIATCSHPKTVYRLFAEHAMCAFRADFAVFYPYNPTTTPEKLLEEDCVPVGDLRTPWQPPRGGLGGGVHRVLEAAKDGLLIVNDLESQGGRLHSHLAKREGVKAYIALRLEMVPEGQIEPRLAGMLFLDFRECTAFEPDDLVGLRLAGNRVAAAIHRLQLLAALQKQWEQRSRQLRTVVGIFQAFREHRDGYLILKRIAEEVNEALDIDVCTLLEYDSEKGEFSERGAAGLKDPGADYTHPNEFKSWFLDKPDLTVIPDVQQDERLWDSGFVQREKIKSVIVYPLRVEIEPLGLLFANYRYHKEPTSDELEAIGLFADLAARVLHEARLREELGRTQKRLQRRLFLDWVSMIETTWRHSLVQKSAAIRNHTALLQRRLAQFATSPPATMECVQETVAEIDRLAEGIAAAPPRVPQSWEMEAELVPLAPLLEEVAQREEGKPSPLRAGPPIRIRVAVETLGGVQVRGYRRWLIYALEALLQNADSAMPQRGTVTITGRREGKWAEVRIQDTGTGVPEAIRCRLFRELIPKEQDKAGMGIGGLLAATIVEEHEGSIELEKPGPGDTTVLIRLPVAGDAEQ
jgi:GAF domain-containing protein/ActR/RegA family two-component response regulator